MRERDSMGDRESMREREYEIESFHWSLVVTTLLSCS